MDKRLDYEYLNSCRLLSGLTNKAIAEDSNASEPTISRFFHGEMKDPSAALLCSVCNTIGASVDRAFGIVKPIDTAMTEPAPSIPAVVTDVVQSLPPLMDPKEFAEAVVAELPKRECDCCKAARTYEATIALQTKIIIGLGSSLGLMVLFLMILLLGK